MGCSSYLEPLIRPGYFNLDLKTQTGTDLKILETELKIYKYFLAKNAFSNVSKKYHHSQEIIFYSHFLPFFFP